MQKNTQALCCSAVSVKLWLDANFLFLVYLEVQLKNRWVPSRGYLLKMRWGFAVALSTAFQAMLGGSRARCFSAHTPPSRSSASRWTPSQQSEETVVAKGRGEEGGVRCHDRGRHVLIQTMSMPPRPAGAPPARPPGLPPSAPPGRPPARPAGPPPRGTV